MNNISFDVSEKESTTQLAHTFFSSIISTQKATNLEYSLSILSVPKAKYLNPWCMLLKSVH